MATDLSYKLRAEMNWSYSKENDFGDTSNAATYSFSDTIANGTAGDTADLLYLAAPTITASGTLNLDLSGSLTTPFGDTITMVRVKTVFIKFATDNAATSITVGNGTNPWQGWFGATTHTEKVFAQGVMLHHRPDSTGWLVTAGTGDVLKIVNDDASNAADLLIAIAGCSA